MEEARCARRDLRLDADQGQQRSLPGAISKGIRAETYHTPKSPAGTAREKAVLPDGSHGTTGDGEGTVAWRGSCSLWREGKQAVKYWLFLLRGLNRQAARSDAGSDLWQWHDEGLRCHQCRQDSGWWSSSYRNWLGSQTVGGLLNEHHFTLLRPCGMGVRSSTLLEARNRIKYLK
jgi:hypothetical protein